MIFFIQLLILVTVVHLRKLRALNREWLLLWNVELEA